MIARNRAGCGLDVLAAQAGRFGHSEAVTFPDPLLRRFAEARHVPPLTGVDVSAESGVPTSRDARSGLRARYKPEDLALTEGFRQDPRRVRDGHA